MSDRTFCIPPDHPSLAGHFPSDPIVPGVVILQQVLALVEAQRGPSRLVGIPRAKFLMPVRPGETLDVTVDQRAPGQLQFTCRAAGKIVAEGLLRLDAL